MRTRISVVALAVALGAGLFLGAPSNDASANGRVHCVRYGETLSGIASAYGTSVWAICNANGLANPNYIRAGMCLTIPAGGGGHYGGYKPQPYYGGYNAYKPQPYYGGYNYYAPKPTYNYGYYGGYYNNWYGNPYYGGYYGKKW